MRKLKFLSLFALLLASSACATTACTFNEKLFTEDWYRENHAIAIYTWSEKNKEVKGVFRNGNIFSIKHWSCNHYGTHAVMLIGPYASNIPQTLNDAVLMLAETALKKDEVSVLINALKDKVLTLSASPVKVNLPLEQYSEFYLSYNIVNEVIILEIKLYKG